MPKILVNKYAVLSAAYCTAMTLFSDSCVKFTTLHLSLERYTQYSQTSLQGLYAAFMENLESHGIL